MTGIILVFQLLYIDWSPASKVSISERVFTDKAECAEFVSSLAEDGTNTQWVNDDYTFNLLSADDMRFVGGCYTPQEYMSIAEN